MLQSFAGGRLVAERWGTGPAEVLALHGWARSRGDFAPLATAVARPMLALDLPGFGLSPPPPTAWGVEEYAAVVAEEVLPACAPGVVVVGHSFGGRVAVRLAARAPERVGALVLTGAPLYRAPGSRQRPAPAYRAIRALARAHLVPARTLEAARHKHGSADYRNAVGVVRDILVRVLGERDDEAIAAVRCPVELIWGAEDTAAPVSVAERAAAAFARARLEVLPAVDHFVPQRAPDALAAAVGRALAVVS